MEWPKQKNEKVTLETDPRLRSSDEVWVYKKWSCGAQRNHRSYKSGGGCLPRKATEPVVLTAGPALGKMAVATQSGPSNPLLHPVLSCSVVLSFCCPGILCYAIRTHPEKVLL